VRRIIVGAVATCVLAVGYSGVANAAWAGRSGLIAFSRNGNIWLMQPNGTHQHRIARNGTEPTWTPDGKRIAFTRAGTVWVMRADGTHQVQLTDSDSFSNAPAWSPSGRYVLFQSDRGHPGAGDYGIYKRRAIRPLGPILTVEPSQDFQDALEPAYAANGVFSYQRDEDNTSFGNCCEIHVVAGGSDQGIRFCFCFGRVDWGPASHVIAYGDGVYDSTIDDFTKSRITVVRADGTHPHVITHPADGLFDERPSWAPGGTWLVYDQLQSGFSVSNGVFKIRGDGTGRVRIAGNAIDPSWQPLP
jgi:dipeptidyl aminopeptidase/acylaminoacyl peptidase